MQACTPLGAAAALIGGNLVERHAINLVFHVLPTAVLHSTRHVAYAARF
jgi:hypothetical protein